ncbi:MAG: 16S rRNA (guanine(527)-N(7))-methyltransferase RsmG [Deltaproteobacteria bacterium]|nr:16S rRNA (guanine(527)-N(7))-methyltransferase RsmG [Deltaproteobacteria bacterium]MCK5709751.1 16S rRNA (guanine(527)-N(7))-methyltransferase RsmG [Deltaproteobacteria bacterium]
MSLKEYLIEGARELGIDISEKDSDLFFKYLENLKTWNDKINLTSIKNDREIIISHFLDSISIASLIEDGKKVLDIGSGAGFPGIPLKIVRRGLEETLLDSVNKKVSFMNDTIRKLELQDINAVWGRAEDLDNEVPRGSFDYVLTRAVGSMSDTLRLSSPYVSENGVIILMRGKRGSEEWNTAIEDIGNKVELVEFKDMTLPLSDLKRIILVLRPL